MSGYSVKLPLGIDPSDGIQLNKDLKSVVKQNFINLIMTIPGERVMDPNFGVGMARFLFEKNDNKTRANIRGKIYQQTGIYLPYIKIENIQFSQADGLNDEIDNNSINLIISYHITSLEESDVLDFSMKNGVFSFS